eukprot:403330736
MAQRKENSQNKQQNAEPAGGNEADQVFDLLNFKGIFFENEHQKYTCPKTGAHFEPTDLCRRLLLAKANREKLEKSWAINQESTPKANQKQLENVVPQNQIQEQQKAQDQVIKGQTNNMLIEESFVKQETKESNNITEPPDDSKNDQKSSQIQNINQEHPQFQAKGIDILEIKNEAQYKSVSPDKPPRIKQINPQVIQDVHQKQMNVLNQKVQYKQEDPIEGQVIIDTSSSVNKTKNETWRQLEETQSIIDAYGDKSTYNFKSSTHDHLRLSSQLKSNNKQQTSNLNNLRSTDKLLINDRKESQQPYGFQQQSHLGQSASKFPNNTAEYLKHQHFPSAQNNTSHKQQNLMSSSQDLPLPLLSASTSNNPQINAGVFNKTMQTQNLSSALKEHSTAAVRDSYNTKSANQIDFDYQGYKESERNGTQQLLIQDSNQHQQEMSKHRRGMTSLSNKYGSQNPDPSGQQHNQTQSFSKTLFNQNQSATSNGSIPVQGNKSYNQQQPNSYVLMPLDAQQDSKKRSKFNIKAAGAPPLYQQNIGNNLNQDQSQNSNINNKRFSTEGDEILKSSHSNIKDTYLQSAIEKYKMRRKQDTVSKQQVNPRQIIQRIANSQNQVSNQSYNSNIMMSGTKSNFQSFDKTIYSNSLVQNSNKNTASNYDINHNRSNTTIYNNNLSGSPGQTQFMQDRTRNSKIHGNVLRIHQAPRPNKQLGNSYLTTQTLGGNYTGGKNGTTMNQLDLLLQAQNPNNFGIIGSKKDIQGYQQLQLQINSNNLYGSNQVANNHRKNNSMQGMQMAYNSAGANNNYQDTSNFQTLPNPNSKFSPEKTKLIFHQKKSSIPNSNGIVNIHPNNIQRAQQ